VERVLRNSLRARRENGFEVLEPRGVKETHV
jgi:hypothetical protein